MQRKISEKGITTKKYHLIRSHPHGVRHSPGIKRRERCSQKAGRTRLLTTLLFPGNCSLSHDETGYLSFRTMVRSVLRRNVTAAYNSCSIATRLRVTKAAAKRDATRVLQPSASAACQILLKGMFQDVEHAWSARVYPLQTGTQMVSFVKAW
jgi:hypothetical protein